MGHYKCIGDGKIEYRRGPLPLEADPGVPPPAPASENAATRTVGASLRLFGRRLRLRIVRWHCKQAAMRAWVARGCASNDMLRAARQNALYAEHQERMEARIAEITSELGT